jgi:hypothetical protein
MATIDCNYDYGFLGPWAWMAGVVTAGNVYFEAADDHG